ncbi:MAG: small basic protein [Candidatus Omnitrophica bacterium]|nr:small basic protein [Candidatus Omnitrophota bacterium]
MSLHPSLKVDTAGVQQRTVLTRIERIKDLMKKDLWHDAHSVTGLPKTKIIKIKAARKEKNEDGETEGEAKAEATPEKK